MPFRVTRQILHDNKTTFDIPPNKYLHWDNLMYPKTTGTLKENKQNWDWTRLTNNDSSKHFPPHGNLKKFPPTLLALAIAAHATATP
jgi:hypothetical protein